MRTSDTTSFYAAAHLDASNLPSGQPAPQPTQLEIDAFVLLLAQISRRLLTDASAVVAA